MFACHFPDTANAGKLIKEEY